MHTENRTGNGLVEHGSSRPQLAPVTFFTYRSYLQIVGVAVGILRVGENSKIFVPHLVGAGKYSRTNQDAVYLPLYIAYLLV